MVRMRSISKPEVLVSGEMSSEVGIFNRVGLEEAAKAAHPIHPKDVVADASDKDQHRMPLLKVDPAIRLCCWH